MWNWTIFIHSHKMWGGSAYFRYSETEQFCYWVFHIRLVSKYRLKILTLSFNYILYFSLSIVKNTSISLECQQLQSRILRELYKSWSSLTFSGILNRREIICLVFLNIFIKFIDSSPSVHSTIHSNCLMILKELCQFLT